MTQLDTDFLLNQFSEKVSVLIDSYPTPPYLIGIHRGGVWLADWLSSRLSLTQYGEVDISFYRDDFSTNGLQPQVKPSNIPFAVDDKNIILIDDVLFSGRTVRAAINEIFDYGRPKSISLACLIDIGNRQLPIEATVCAQKMKLNDNQRIELQGPEPLRARIVTISP